MFRNKPEPAETEDVLQGDSWYVVHLSKVDLMCEERFGLEKKTFEI